MLRAFKISILVWLLISFNVQIVHSQACGTERRVVKQGADSTFDLVDLDNPIQTSISQMNSWAYPPASKRKNTRINIHEKKVYRIRATLTEYKRESNDSDYHLVLEDENGNTLIGEIISPTCIESHSPIFNTVVNVRQAFDNRFSGAKKPTSSPKTANEHDVTITGIGFFDFRHHQIGLARNAIEIHPILEIVFATAAPGPSAITIPPTVVPPISVESFDSEWIPVSKNKRKQIIRPVDSFAKSSTGVAVLGGYNLADDSLSRTVEIPAGAQSKLVFSTNVFTTEKATAVPFDVLTVEIKSTAEEINVPITLNNRTSVDSSNKKGVYFERTVDLSEFAGQTIEIRFHAITDKRRPTSFRIDDISITQ
jgi:hypothetical protein